MSLRISLPWGPRNLAVGILEEHPIWDVPAIGESTHQSCVAGEAVQKLQEMPEVEAALNPARNKSKAKGGDASASGDLSKVERIMI